MLYSHRGSLYSAEVLEATVDFVLWRTAYSAGVLDSTVNLELMSCQGRMYPVGCFDFTVFLLFGTQNNLPNICITR